LKLLFFICLLILLAIIAAVTSNQTAKDARNAVGSYVWKKVMYFFMIGGGIFVIFILSLGNDDPIDPDTPTTKIILPFGIVDEIEYDCDEEYFNCTDELEYQESKFAPHDEYEYDNEEVEKASSDFNGELDWEIEATPPWWKTPAVLLIPIGIILLYFIAAIISFFR
jgi:hypothetical protein